MGILASAPVPAANRLIDADTATGLTVIRRTGTSNQGRWPMNQSRPAFCPTWCRRDHTGEVTEYEGFTIGTLHEQVLTELDALDPAWVTRTATAAVLVERSDEAGEVITPTRVVLNIAEGPIEGINTPLVTQGWTGTPAQARALAAALLAAAELVDGGGR